MRDAGNNLVSTISLLTITFRTYAPALAQVARNCSLLTSTPLSRKTRPLSCRPPYRRTPPYSDRVAPATDGCGWPFNSTLCGRRGIVATACSVFLTLANHQQRPLHAADPGPGGLIGRGLCFSGIAQAYQPADPLWIPLLRCRAPRRPCAVALPSIRLRLLRTSSIVIVAGKRLRRRRRQPRGTGATRPFLLITWGENAIPPSRPNSTNGNLPPTFNDVVLFRNARDT